ncbi:unnamed protein product [Meganyctiphanes norvegica]|uniref:Hsp90 co-chaperone Cdc37 n=1 Tax=Meganyctiphanes norvegica TaxID=48144 RepID=A0AAV2PLU6_MEGNR
MSVCNVRYLGKFVNMVDYSKWKDIEVSDDEDDIHPNIDTPSLFRWRHQARVERMDESQKEKDALLAAQKEHEKKVKDIKEKLKVKESTDMSDVKKSLTQLEEEAKKIREKQAELEKKERLEPWNVDTISSDGFSKTIINTTTPWNKDDDMTEDEKEKKMKEFIKKYEKEIKKYGMFKNYDDSRRFLMENPHLADEDTANYMVIWCINLEMEDKHELMNHVSHQTICMQFILELAKQLKRDPRSCISAFFHRIQQAEAEYMRAFNEELDGFKSRVKKRAQEKIDAAMKEIEEEERQARLGPGGLDPLEVLEELPKELKECFESQNIQNLKDCIKSLDVETATYHMKRCVDSGLWVPEGNLMKEEGDEEEGKSKEDA